MTDTLLPPVARFVDGVRDRLASGLSGHALWTAVADALRVLLGDPALRAHARSWPDTSRPGEPPGNLLFYEDPDYGFVLNALVKAPNAVTSVHDHGQSWTLYGVLEGGERIERFAAAGGAKQPLAREGEFDVVPGYIDVVPPWQIHRETNGPHRTIGFIVRSQRSGTFAQYRYDPATGAPTEYRGPTQIPFRLT